MLAISWKIKDMDKAYSSGKMGKNIEDNGRTENNMELECIRMLKVRKRKGNG